MMKLEIFLQKSVSVFITLYLSLNGMYTNKHAIFTQYHQNQRPVYLFANCKLNDF